MTKIVVEFSGWVECDSDKVMFQSLSEDNSRQLITGTEWLRLSEDEQDDYILEDYTEAQRTALYGSLEHLDVIVVNDDGTEKTASRTYS